ncbi:uncharacterized protein YktA (UPF0223 family) [Peribacillus deserti]|uniref:UPF0223 protein JOC77_001852 n=1 Tax=Peribacillus deserti TaxID=673318 RepID=A0ABS2QGZ7_9BACI|nr:UPF0223 family protein [Peribacillus deserti]MBM7692422.1 uncharacterized protein YktA (UPF0223 family) [Peribacillus deserti]
MDYQYPIDYSWSTEETIDVIKFFESVEQAYEKGITKEQFMDKYRRFKQIVPGKAEEKKLTGEFEEMSGYSSYKILQKAKTAEEGSKLSMQP